jgi:hypothetical protein
MATDPAPARARRHSRILVGLALAGVLALGLLSLLVPASAPLAAGGGDETRGATPAATPAAGSSNFGSATPSDKFVQSFQQQVSQQLQTALRQASEAQENRLREFELQQRAIGEQLQAIEHSLDTAGAAHAAAPDPVDGANVEAPRVNLRRRSSSEAPADAGTAGVPGWPAAVPVEPTPGAGPTELPDFLGSPFLMSGPGGPRPGPANSRLARPGDANIAPHGFVEGRLLNGVVAIVDGPDRESIVALSGTYQSANGFLSDLDGCFALVQGKPEIAAGRIDFKLSRLTCNFPDGSSRTWDAAGWLVDADGIRGVRASIVENVGRKAAVAAAGGALGGIGQRLSQEQYQISSGLAGPGLAAVGMNSAFVGSAGRDAAGGAASGAAAALGQSINDYYNLYAPSLQVGGGTPVTVVLANDLRLPPSGRQISQTHTALP